MIKYLPWAMGLGGALVLLASGLALLRYLAFRQRARADKGFAIRKPSLSPAEWQRWNGDFWGWKVLRVPLLVTLLEALLLAFVLEIPTAFFALALFSMLWQILPLALLYMSQLVLLFLYGRFHLERFDNEQALDKGVAMMFFVWCAWMPFLAAWTYMHTIHLAAQ